MTDPVRVVCQQLQSPNIGRAEESHLRLTWTEAAAQWYEAQVSSFTSFQSFRRKILRVSRERWELYGGAAHSFIQVFQKMLSALDLCIC